MQRMTLSWYKSLMLFMPLHLHDDYTTFTPEHRKRASFFHMTLWTDQLSVASKVILALTCAVIIFYSSWFWLGTKESFDALMDQLILNYLCRAFWFSLLGLPSLVVISIVELVSSQEKNIFIEVNRKTMIAAVALFVASLLGCFVFFISG